jgi:type IX secretion system PorP/SprF family membrane protein
MHRLFQHIALILLLTVSSTTALQAQQDPKFNQYMFNPLGINPAYAGSREAVSVVGLYRNQWVGIEGAPVTQTFAIHGPIRQKKMGLGFQITNDNIGPRTNIAAEIDYAYRFRLFGGNLSLGLGLGFQYIAFDWNKIDYRDQGDVIPTYGVEQVMVPDADFGIFYSTNKFYAGLELAHLTEPRLNVSDSSVNGANAYRQFRHYSFTLGRAFVLNEHITLRPSILYKQAGLFEGMIDLNFSVLIEERLWAGVIIRPQFGGAAILEYKLSDLIRIGYSFDYPINDLRLSQGSSHEIFLGLEFGLPKNTPVSPRYF